MKTTTVILQRLTLSLFFFFGWSVAFSQTKALFNPGIEVGVPVGDYSNVYTPAPGVSLKLELPAAKNTFITLSAGFIKFKFTDDFKQQLLALGNTQSSAGFVPIKLGAKYYFNMRFFGEGQLGLSAGTAKSAGTSFVYAPGMGYSFARGWEVGLRYEAWTKSGSTFSQLGLRLGYRL